MIQSDILPTKVV